MTSAGVVHLPESSAAPWPGESFYRPPGWRSKLAPGEIGPRLAVVTSQLEEDWENAKLITERKRLEEHVTLLRQMWVTREWVWRMAEALVGPPELDPFWHPWSHVHRLWGGVRLLDGNDGRDGFNLSLWGRVGIVDASKPGLPTINGSTRGRTAYVNGPHGDTARYVETCARAARAKHKVAAVVALDGCGWFAGNTTAEPLAAPDAATTVGSKRRFPTPAADTAPPTPPTPSPRQRHDALTDALGGLVLSGAVSTNTIDAAAACGPASLFRPTPTALFRSAPTARAAHAGGGPRGVQEPARRADRRRVDAVVWALSRCCEALTVAFGLSRAMCVPRGLLRRVDPCSKERVLG